MQALALGQMGMSEWEFLFISPRAFYNKLRGFDKLRQAEYELVRLQTVELLNIHIEKTKRIKRPQDLWEFPWEKENKKISKKVANHTAERVARRIERIEKRHGGK